MAYEKMNAAGCIPHSIKLVSLNVEYMVVFASEFSEFAPDISDNTKFSDQRFVCLPHYYNYPYTGHSFDIFYV